MSIAMPAYFLAAGTGVPGSRVVQIVLSLLFFALMFVSSQRGYKRGPIRQVAPIASFAIAAIVALVLGGVLGRAFLGALGIPWILRGICGTVLVCLFVWVPVFGWFWHKGRNSVSEKTGEPEQPVLGALVGCWTGIFWGALVLFCVSAAGAVGESYLAVRPGYEKTICGKILFAAAKAKNSVALYPRLSFLKTWSPLPEAAIDVVSKVLDVLRSREAQQRLLQLPEIQSLVTDPAIYPVLSDPEIEAKFNRRDVDGLLADKRIQRMLSDEAFQRRIAALELEPLLDYALQGGPPPLPPANSAVPANSAPAESVPASSVPAQSVPANAAPANSVPTGSVPAENASANSVPAENAPAN